MADVYSVDAAIVYWSHQSHCPPASYSIEPIANGAYYHLLVAVDALALEHFDLSQTVALCSNTVANHFAQRNSTFAVDLEKMDMAARRVLAAATAYVNVLIDVNLFVGRQCY